MPEPILPRNYRSPLNDSRLVNLAFRRIQKANTETARWLLGRFRQIPYNKYQVENNAQEETVVDGTTIITANVTRYEYLIDVGTLEDIIREFRQKYRQSFGDAVVAEAVQGYEAGTANAVTNLSGLTDDYKRTIQSVFVGQPYQSRVAFVRSRVFELMQGFQGEAAAELSRVLGDVVENGFSVSKAMKMIRSSFESDKVRAERIARTEITGALRRGRWDEAQDAQERLGVRTKLLHLSALLETSRHNHISRHGDVFTIGEVREWYSIGANAINCRCSQVEVLVDENGKPISDRSIKKALEVKKRLGF